MINEVDKQLHEYTNYYIVREIDKTHLTIIAANNDSRWSLFYTVYLTFTR